MSQHDTQVLIQEGVAERIRERLVTSNNIQEPILVQNPFASSRVCFDIECSVFRHSLHKSKSLFGPKEDPNY